MRERAPSTGQRTRCGSTSCSRRLAAHRPDRQLSTLAQRLVAARRALDRLALTSVRMRQEKLRDLVRTLHAVSPLDVIARGYAVLTSDESGAVISSVSQVADGDRVAAQLKDGKLDCIVESVTLTGPADFVTAL